MFNSIKGRKPKIAGGKNNIKLNFLSYNKTGSQGRKAVTGLKFRVALNYTSTRLR